MKKKLIWTIDRVLSKFVHCVRSRIGVLGAVVLLFASFCIDMSVFLALLSPVFSKNLCRFFLHTHPFQKPCPSFSFYCPFECSLFKHVKIKTCMPLIPIYICEYFPFRFEVYLKNTTWYFYCLPINKSTLSYSWLFHFNTKCK